MTTEQSKMETVSRCVYVLRKVLTAKFVKNDQPNQTMFLFLLRTEYQIWCLLLQHIVR